ncbi:hypothetical protein GPECTOR_1g515 [Gonium pectorale]|uniref:Kinesin motor domain-containing protein n=1 Tax=Gonium pectorale TaxID=33097 RepID=A0A150H3G9_GONPE|nr:hypothetical protein GPECTOR_1g515 [Gonium pectorale]|eukprot:KXZ56573.1 hypothetical protein GPECTOR_1g515 [Gonium pectorale]
MSSEDEEVRLLKTAFGGSDDETVIDSEGHSDHDKDWTRGFAQRATEPEFKERKAKGAFVYMKRPDQPGRHFYVNEEVERVKARRDADKLRELLQRNNFRIYGTVNVGGYQGVIPLEYNFSGDLEGEGRRVIVDPDDPGALPRVVAVKEEERQEAKSPTHGGSDRSKSKSSKKAGSSSSSSSSSEKGKGSKDKGSDKAPGSEDKAERRHHRREGDGHGRERHWRRHHRNSPAERSRSPSPEPRHELGDRHSRHPHDGGSRRHSSRHRHSSRRRSGSRHRHASRHGHSSRHRSGSRARRHQSRPRPERRSSSRHRSAPAYPTTETASSLSSYAERPHRRHSSRSRQPRHHHGDEGSSGVEQERERRRRAEKRRSPDGHHHRRPHDRREHSRERRQRGHSNSRKDGSRPRHHSRQPRPDREERRSPSRSRHDAHREQRRPPSRERHDKRERRYPERRDSSRERRGHSRRRRSSSRRPRDRDEREHRREGEARSRERIHRSLERAHRSREREHRSRERAFRSREREFRSRERDVRLGGHERRDRRRDERRAAEAPPLREAPGGASRSRAAAKDAEDVLDVDVPPPGLKERLKTKTGNIKAKKITQKGEGYVVADTTEEDEDDEEREVMAVRLERGAGRSSRAPSGPGSAKSGGSVRSAVGSVAGSTAGSRQLQRLPSGRSQASAAGSKGTAAEDLEPPARPPRSPPSRQESARSGASVHSRASAASHASAASAARTEASAAEVFVRVKPVMEEDLRQAVGTGVLSHFIQGSNATIMAYGQTGSGKTHTMFGQNEGTQVQVQGLLHLALNYIDEKVTVGPHFGLCARLSASVFEIYNDEIFSLLGEDGVGRRHLHRGAADFAAHAPKQVSNVDEATSLVMEALQHRSRDTTARNSTSSRSHAFVKLRLEQPPRGDEPGTVSSLFLVDLAGSESITHANSAAQQRETIAINKSLNVLERVVNALSTLGATALHIPYRDSLLTQVLQDGLSPMKSRVALVATISRFLQDLAVTKSTLLFAQRARNVRTYAQVNVVSRRLVPAGSEDMSAQLQALQASNNSLRQALADLEGQQDRQTRQRQASLMLAELQRQENMYAELQRTASRQLQDAETALEAERAAHAVTRLELSELQQAVAAEQEEARTASSTAGELRRQAAELRLEVARLNGELAGARALAEEVQGQSMAAHEQLLQAKEQLTTLKGRLAAAEEAGSHKQELELRLAQLHGEMESVREEASADTWLVQQRLEGLQQQLFQAQELAERHGQELVRERDCSAQLQRQLEAAREEAGGHSSRARELEQELGRMASALSIAEGQLAAANDCIAARDGQLAAAEEDLAARQRRLEEPLAVVREQLAAAEAAKAAAEIELATARRQKSVAEEALKAETATSSTLRLQLTAAVEARAAGEAAADERLVPLTTENERLRATCSLVEEQLARLQADCERLRGERSDEAQRAGRLEAECSALRGSLHRAEAEAAERVARLEAQLERDVTRRDATKRDATKQLTDRIRQLEMEKKGMEEVHRGHLELKDKLIHQLENIIQKLQQVDSDKARQDTTAVSMPDQQGSGGGSPVAAPASSSRSDGGAPPDRSPPATATSTGRAPAVTGMLLRTTGSAAALARNTRSVANFSTPSTAPKPPARMASAAAAADAVTTPPARGGNPDPIDLTTPPSTGGLDSLLEVVREQERARPHQLNTATTANRLRMNY